MALNQPAPTNNQGPYVFPGLRLTGGNLRDQEGARVNCEVCATAMSCFNDLLEVVSHIYGI